MMMDSTEGRSSAGGATAYRPDIDGLRAVAVLAVVGFHAFPGWIRGGFVGVDIFFVISGFLISGIIFRELESDSFSLRSFYERRIRRIFPALILVLSIVLLIGGFILFADEYRVLGKHVLAGSVFASNFVLWSEVGYFDQQADAKPLLHLWSLGVEEQFYIVWPLLLWVCWRFRSSLLAAALLVVGASLLACLVLIDRNQSAAFYSPFTRFWELGAGALLALGALRRLLFGRGLNLWQRQGLQDLMALIGASLVLLPVWALHKGSVFPGASALPPVVGAVLLIGAGRSSWIGRKLLSAPLMVWFGRISYPLYLWHWPLLVFAHIIYAGNAPRSVRVGVVVASVVLAWLTHATVERWLRSTRRYSSEKLVFLMVSMIMVGATGAWIFSRDGLPDRSIEARRVGSAVHSPDVNTSPCGFDLPRALTSLCSAYQAGSTRKTLVLWGDSSVGAWAPVFQAIARDRGYRVVQIMHPSCPPLIGVRKTYFAHAASRDYCATGAVQQEIVDYIRGIDPDLIFVMANWGAYSPPGGREYVADEAVSLATADTTRAALQHAVPVTLKQLRQISGVVVFRPWPLLPGKPNYAAARAAWLEPFDAFASMDSVEFRRGVAFVDGLLQQQSGITLFDPAGKICDAQLCRTVLDGTAMYSDEYHLSRAGSMLFRSDIQNLLDHAGL